MKKVIIAVHGLGNKPEADVLKAGWLKAIQEGLNRIEKVHDSMLFEMVYWADISYRDPLDPEETNPKAPLYLRSPYWPATSEPLAKPHRMHMAVMQFIERNLDRLFLRTNLDETFPAASAKMMERYFSDLDTYYTDECRSLQDKDCSVKSAIQKRLTQMLKKYAGYDILLITHSMGSIIAFDTLSNPENNFPINTLITMGSPLGLPPIVSRIFQAQKTGDPTLKKPQTPEAIWPHWYNLSDLRDKVALDHTLRDDYATNSRGIRALDLHVINDYQVNANPNPHKSYGYLRAPETAEIIDTFLYHQRNNPFRIACRLINSNLLSIPRRLWKKIN